MNRNALYRLLVLLIFLSCFSCNKESETIYQWHFNSSQTKSTIEEHFQTEYQISSNFEKPEFVKGIEGTGLRFDGYSTFVKGALPQSIKEPITISSWVALETYPTDIASFYSLLGEYNNSINWISASIDKFGKSLISVGYNGEEKYYYSKIKLPKYKWFNVALLLNEKNVDLAINGKIVLNVALKELTNKTCFSSIVIGKNAKDKYLDNIFPLTHINGIIDELKIWNKAIDTNDFQAKEIGNKYDQKAILAIPESRFKKDFNRPKYHLLPSANWTNETHGLIYYSGKYHIFNQKNGTNLFLGQINWGHFSSPDLVQWTEHKTALTPEEGYDDIGIWSGHVVKDENDVPIIVYTGGSEKEIGMCLAFPKDKDLIAWEKYKNNPVVKGPPRQYSRRDFRDPYIWKDKNVWYMIVGYGLIENDVQKGALLLYKSKDLKKWNYLHPFFKGNPKLDNSGIFWEMPVFWKMKGKYILAVNPIPYNGKPAINLYWTGDFIDEKFVPDNILPKKLEVINRMLSPSVSLDKDGNTTAIAIIPDLITRELQIKHGWTHLYSIPRIWTLKNGEISQIPHPSLVKLRDSLNVFEKVNVKSSSNLKIGKGHQLEIIADISTSQSDKFGFYIGKNRNNNEETKIYFELQKNQLVIDQTNSSRTESIEKRIEIGDLNLGINKTIKIHLFIDGSVVEGFINNKEAFTTRIFPKYRNSNEVEVFSENGFIFINKLELWHLKSSNNLSDF